MKLRKENHEIERKKVGKWKKKIKKKKRDRSFTVHNCEAPQIILVYR